MLTRALVATALLAGACSKSDAPTPTTTAAPVAPVAITPPAPEPPPPPEKTQFLSAEEAGALLERFQGVHSFGKEIWSVEGNRFTWIKGKKEQKGTLRAHSPCQLRFQIQEENGKKAAQYRFIPALVDGLDLLSGPMLGFRFEGNGMACFGDWLYTFDPKGTCKRYGLDPMKKDWPAEELPCKVGKQGTNNKDDGLFIIPTDEWLVFFGDILAPVNRRPVPALTHESIDAARAAVAAVAALAAATAPDAAVTP
ncbi:MAG: hypothetical protein EXR73_06970 [Myxococcales bacterium]|nr:hypothetical protein [Myxococcales bacterium]